MLQQTWVLVGFLLWVSVPSGSAGAARVTSNQLPLRTVSRWIVDSAGRRVKWSCVNWSGAAQKDGVPGGLQHQSTKSIADTFARMGFNCVRVPWSVNMVLMPHKVYNESLLGANPALLGKSTLQVLDAVVEACAAASLMVILDNHMSDPDWCCSEQDQNGLWYNDRYSEADWIHSHVLLAKRYVGQPYVVAGELRNELRASVVGGVNLEPTWGSGDNNTDWVAAAERAAAAILSARPEGYLIVIDGLSYSTDFRKAYTRPAVLSVPNRLVYSAHDYSWSQSSSSQLLLHEHLGQYWGFLIRQHETFTAPVWVSEFGSWHDGRDFQSGWWPWFLNYLHQGDLDFSYWRGDGTESRGTGRTFGSEAGFGLLNATWNGPAADGLLLKQLVPLQHATQGPGIDQPLVRLVNDLPRTE